MPLNGLGTGTGSVGGGGRAHGCTDIQSGLTKRSVRE